MSDTKYAELNDEISRLQKQLVAMKISQKRDSALAEDEATRLIQFEAMLDVVPVGVVLSNEVGQIIAGNAAVEKMLLHPVFHSAGVDAYGEWISFHEDGRRVESREYPLARVISDGEAYSELDVNYQRGDGSTFWLRIVGEPVLDKTGKRIGAVVVLIDVDREQQMARRQKVLIGELNHRVKNAFSVFKSIVSQSLRKEAIPQGVRKTIDNRLNAYADAHAKLLGSDWADTELLSLVQDVVVKIAGDRVTFDGPLVTFNSREALSLSMALYELCVNAVKYGALSNAEGRINLRWRVAAGADGEEVIIDWVEQDGPKVVHPSEAGFGSFILNRALSMETGGEVDMTYAEDGFAWTLRMPLKSKTE